MKLTESGLRNIIRQELKKTLNLKEMSMPMQRSSLPLEPDTLMINNNKDYDNYIDNKSDFTMEDQPGAPGYYVGTQEAILAQAQVASSENSRIGKGNVATPIKSIGTARQWDNLNNGGPHPVVLWLKKNRQIKFVYDDENFGYDIVDAAEWVETNS